MTPRRTGQPPHRDVLALQRTLRAALEQAQDRFAAEAVLQAMAQQRPDGSEGLTALLADLDVRTAADLLDLLRVFTVSSSYTAVSWARGIALSDGGEPVSAEDVLRTSWTHAAWTEPELSG